MRSPFSLQQVRSPLSSHQCDRPFITSTRSPFSLTNAIASLILI
ncbi:MAG: hypothetical protein VKJ64_08820 [Leptolyngbyaceae bacterium]|nr:hypothetical protein [Leptolyngbyaceae bacterium]